ncbi:MAG: hypothetical protein JO356_14275 [Acidobacteria bacterium]|nr:hypothetical protein [Acidobacteriota bacterium]
MTRYQRVAAIVGCALCAVVAFPSDEPASSMVSFTLDFPGANPSHYEISISRDGHGSYSSNGQLSRDADPADPVTFQFSPSEQVRQQIFALAKQARFFNGTIDSGRKNIANTGAKTLSYNDGTVHTQATYNFSLMPAVEQLTDLFQGLSTTLEFGRRLAYFHKYQKLALDDDLKRMQDLEQSHMLADVQAIAPVLESIGNDSSVMRVTRARALQLLGPGKL